MHLVQGKISCEENLLTRCLLLTQCFIKSGCFTAATYAAAFWLILNTFMLIFCCKHTSVQIIFCWHEEACLLVGLIAVDSMLQVVSFCKDLKQAQGVQLLLLCFSSAGRAMIFFFKIEPSKTVNCLWLSSFFENVIN